MKKLFCLYAILVMPWMVVARDIHQSYQFFQQHDHQIHLLTLSPKEYKLILVKAPGDRATVDELNEAYHGVAAINAGFFEVGEGRDGQPAGVLKINQKWLGYSRLPRAAMAWDNSNNTIWMDRLQARQAPLLKEIHLKPQFHRSSREMKRWRTFPYIVGGTPLLIKQGKILHDHHVEQTKASFINERHARTAVCVKKNQDIVLMVVSHTKAEDRDSTDKIAEGMTIAELSEFLQAQGCVEAINFDGGGSSTMVVAGDIVNEQAGDRVPLTGIFKARPVSDAIVVLPR